MSQRVNYILQSKIFFFSDLTLKSLMLIKFADGASVFRLVIMNFAIDPRYLQSAIQHICITIRRKLTH